MYVPFYSKEYFLNGFLVYTKNIPVALSRSDLDLKACMLLSFTFGSEFSAQLILGVIVVYHYFLSSAVRGKTLIIPLMS